MQKISMLAKEHDLFLIEDCAEAIGSIYNGKKVGSFGDVSCFSFFGNKTMTTGEGGMLLTNSKDLYEKAANIKNQGVSDSKEYWHNRIGYNFRMTNIQAAIGLAQLTIVEKNLEDKAKLFSLYKNGLADLPVKMLDSVGNAKNSFWMCCLLVESEELRDSLREFLKNKGIETRPTFYTCHTMGLFDFVGSFPNAEFLSVRGINLPSFPDLTTVEIDYIINSIKEFYDLNG